MIAIYTLAALPFFTGGAVISLAITRFRSHVNIVYGADLLGAAAGCLLLLPLLNRFGAPESCCSPRCWVAWLRCFSLPARPRPERPCWLDWSSAFPAAFSCWDRPLSM
jgi:hypothetical protein